MRRSYRGFISPVNLCEVYAQIGEYSVKFIIDANLSQSVDSVDVKMINSDGKPMVFSSKRWGTKINVSFLIDGDTPDGVSIIDVVMKGRTIDEVRERFSIWIVK